MMKHIQAGFVGVAGSLLLFAGVALATDSAMMGDSMHSGGAMPSSMMMMHPPAPMVLSINADGTGRLRGVVSAVSSTSLSIATWGGTWTVQTTASTQEVPAGSAFTDIKVGDYVGVVGTVSENTPTMTASTIRDWTNKGAMMHTDTMMMHDKMGTSSNAMMHGDMMHDKMATSSGSMNH